MIKNFVQEQSAAAVDTVSKGMAQKWDAMSNMDQSGSLVQVAASHDLIFIVLGVSLIIWLVLLTFIIRLDKKVEKLEKEIENQ